MLAWPAFAVLKHYWPEAKIYALVPSYTAEMAELCPWIDEVVIDNNENARQLSRKLAVYSFDVMLTLYSTARVAIAAYLARIPYRLAPATKLFQLFYNHRLVQRRSRSEKPEYAYNIDLVYQLTSDIQKKQHEVTKSSDDTDYFPELIKRPLLSFPTREGNELRAQFYKKHDLPSESKLIFIHPGSGGSANNITPNQYIELCNSLQCIQPIFCIVTAGPGEREIAEAIAKRITEHKSTCLPCEKGLNELAHYLNLADLFISCSTGPLHIAGALDRPTATFYPRHRSGSPLRWQTLNAPEKRLFFTPPYGSDEKDVASINVNTAAGCINRHFLC